MMQTLPCSSAAVFSGTFPASGCKNEQNFVKKCGKLVVKVLSVTNNQWLHRKFGSVDRHHIVLKLLDLRPLTDEESGEAMIQAIKTDKLQPMERTDIIHRLNSAALSVIARGRAVCFAIEKWDSKAVAELFSSGSIPERKGSIHPQDQKDMPCSWQQAVQIALKQNAKTSLEILFSRPNISIETRCEAFYDAFRSGYRGRLEWLLGFVPNAEMFRANLILNASRNGLKDIADELTVGCASF